MSFTKVNTGQCTNGARLEDQGSGNHTTDLYCLNFKACRTVGNNGPEDLSLASVYPSQCYTLVRIKVLKGTRLSKNYLFV